MYLKEHTFPFPTKQLVVSEPVNACRPRAPSAICGDKDDASSDILICRRLLPVPVSKMMILLIDLTAESRSRKTSVSGDLITIENSVD